MAFASIREPQPAGCRVVAAYEPVLMPFEHLSVAERHRRSEEFLAVMAKRRSCRFFSPEQVDEALVVNAVRAAATAPSGANQQPWTFVVVSDPALKASLRAAAEREERDFYAHGPDEWRAALAPLGTDAVKRHITDAPYVIVVFAHIHGVAIDRANGVVSTFKHYYVRESVGIACGILFASLAHAGLAALPHTPPSPGFVGPLLGRPPNERAMLVIPVGLPARDATVPKHALAKKPLDAVLVRR